jgi:hypothetical protein
MGEESEDRSSLRILGRPLILTCSIAILATSLIFSGAAWVPVFSARHLQTAAGVRSLWARASPEKTKNGELAVLRQDLGCGRTAVMPSANWDIGSSLFILAKPFSPGSTRYGSRCLSGSV